MAILKKTKTTQSKKQNSLDLLLLNFAGEHVEIIVDLNVEVPVISPNDPEPIMMNIPLPVQGYITDHDDRFIYLGLSPNQINQCIQKDYVVHISVVDEAMAEFDLQEDGKFAKGKFN